MWRRLGADPRERAATITRSIIIAGTVIVIAIWSVAIASIQTEDQLALERTRGVGRNLAAAFADEVQRVLDDVAANMAVIANRLRDAPGRPDLHAWASEVPLLAGAMVEAKIVGSDGRLITTTRGGSPPSVDLSGDEAVAAQLTGRTGGLFISKPLAGSTPESTRIEVSQRVESADGRLVAVIVFSLAPSRLTNLPRLVDLGPRGVIGLVGLDDVIRARFTRDHPNGLFGVGQALSGLRPERPAEMDEEQFVRKSVIDGVERLFSYRRVPGYPLLVSVGLELEPALDPDANRFITVTAIATLLLAALAVYLFREIRHRTERDIELAEQRHALASTNHKLKVDVALRREAEQRLRTAQETLRDAVESISEAFVIYDANDRLVMCNEAFLNLYRDSLPLVEGTRFEDLLRRGLELGRYPEAAGREDEWFAERVAAHRNPTGPVETLLQGGRWILASDRRMRSGGSAGLRVDITRLKRTESERRHARDHLNRAQRIAKMGSDLHDLVTGVTEWSDEIYRIMGVERGAFVPTWESLLGLVLEEDRGKILAARADLEMGICPEPYECRIRRPDGELRHVRREAELLWDERGHPMAIAGVLHDVTELRASEERQRDLERQLQHSQKLEALGTLAGGIAHDLNNTLTPIVVLSELLIPTMPEGSQARQDLETMLTAGRHSRDLVRSVLSFSRKQDGAKAPVDLAATLRVTLQMLRATTPATVRIADDIEEVPPILGNAAQLQQVIVNLVTNSVQAIDDRMGTVTVKLWREQRRSGGRDRRSGDSIGLKISDTGCGMDRETMTRIFEPFFTTKPVGDGTGLGLALVHGIITGHGGRIHVDSEPGKGTEITILLPIGHAAGATVTSNAA